jgi:hypothetical protein
MPAEPVAPEKHGRSHLYTYIPEICMTTPPQNMKTAIPDLRDVPLDQLLSFFNARI